VIASAGKDGQFERNDLADYLAAPVATTGFDCDIVYSNGAFIEYPQGTQRQ
jgi:hypothetical protein